VDGMTDHTRTPEQWMADVAATTLGRLGRMYDDLQALSGQLNRLAEYAAEHHPDLQHEFLAESAVAARRMTCCVPEFVRDIASRLPIRGLDFDEGPRP
jgi:hypothetical protein